MEELFQNPPERHCRIIARVRQFSNVCTLSHDDETSRRFIGYETSNDDLNTFFTVEVYPNGYDEDSEGSLSVVFNALPTILAQNMELVCFISVIDAENSKRFSQSVVMGINVITQFDPFREFVMNHYLPHRVLLKEPSDLLPGDVLTLQVDAVLKLGEYCMPLQFLDKDHDSVFKWHSGPGGLQEAYLCLDSCIGKLLCENSSYFERLLVTPMKEKASRWVRMSLEEIHEIYNVEKILIRMSPITFSSVLQIFKLYTFADKYDIAFVVDTCRSWLQLCLDNESAAEISGFADKYNDDCLKEAFQDSLNQEYRREVTTEYDGIGNQLYEIRTNQEWTLVKPSKNNFLSLCFSLNTEKKFKNTEKERFDFYS